MYNLTTDYLKVETNISDVKQICHNNTIIHLFLKISNLINKYEYFVIFTIYSSTKYNVNTSDCNSIILFFRWIYQNNFWNILYEYSELFIIFILINDIFCIL